MTMVNVFLTATDVMAVMTVEIRVMKMDVVGHIMTGVYACVYTFILCLILLLPYADTVNIGLAVGLSVGIFCFWYILPLMLGSQASYVIVSGFRAALDLDTYPLSNLICPRCIKRAKTRSGKQCSLCTLAF